MLLLLLSSSSTAMTLIDFVIASAACGFAA
jgi:hypothetical protein